MSEPSNTPPHPPPPRAAPTDNGINLREVAPNFRGFRVLGLQGLRVSEKDIKIRMVHGINGMN